MGQRIAIFASGNGSNLQSILDQVREGKIDADVGLVFSDRNDAFALERAKKASIETLSISPKLFPSREAFDTVLVEELKIRKINWVVLAGFMRILSPLFVRAFKGRILNIHPSLLPKYPGTHAIERAFEAKESEIGVTVHYVDEGVDTGPVLLQEAVRIRPGESLETVTERVHSLEHRLYPLAIVKALRESNR